MPEYPTDPILTEVFRQFMDGEGGSICITNANKNSTELQIREQQGFVNGINIFR